MSVTGPLDGIRVIEVGTLISGPFAGRLLGDMGAEVIKIEPPGAPDPLRTWGQAELDGNHFFWTVHARNKKAVTLNLREEAGRALFLDLVEKSDIIDGTRVAPGDAVIGLASSGPHSNGYSLIRKLVAVAGADTQTKLDGGYLFDRLLAPTRIYVKSLLALMRALPVHGIAHITGGGLTDNVPRILPEGTAVAIAEGSWPVLPVFKVMQQIGNVSKAEMYRTFNMGVGMVLVLSAIDQPAVESHLKQQGVPVYRIGEVNWLWPHNHRHGFLETRGLADK